MRFLWDFFVVPMLFPCYIYDLNMGFPWDSLWDFRDISMIFLWDYHGMSIVSKLKSIDRINHILFRRGARH